MTREEQIRSLMQENIVLAVGCTEPVAVALAVAKAKEVLQEQVESVELQLSKNIIKKAGKHFSGIFNFDSRSSHIFSAWTVRRHICRFTHYWSPPFASSKSPPPLVWEL